MDIDIYNDFILNGHKKYLPQLTIDCIIFGYHEQQLKVLIGKWVGWDKWGFPGGYIGNDEKLHDAAARILKERTSMDDVYLQQFHTFGDSSYRLSKIMSDKLPYNTIPSDNWLLKRTISVGYYALVEFSKVKIKSDLFISDLKWEDLENVPELVFDHSEMLKKALFHMRTQIYHQPIGSNLLPSKFTMPEIQALYQTILEKQIDRRNFPKKLLSYSIIKKLEEKRKIGQHRSPYLYEFDKEGYEKALNEGIALTL